MQGDFTDSLLLDINLKAEEMWSKGTQANVYKSNAEAAKAVLENQTAQFRELDNKDKDQKVKVMWVNPCAVATQDCVGNCELDEPELETDAKEYAYDMCQKSGFSVNRDVLRTNQYNRDELVAKGMAMAIKRLDEWWAVQILLKLKAYAGVNVAPSPYTFDAGAMTTDIPSNQYNLKMVAQLIKQAMMNQMSSPYYIENGELFVPLTDARLDQGNDTGKGDAARAQQLNLYSDLFNFAKAAITEDMFAIDASAVAMKTYARNPDRPFLLDGKIQQTIYTVDSQLLPGVKYDVYYQLACQEKVVNGATRTQYVDTWRLETTGMVALNPEGCEVVVNNVTYKPTGVLSYTEQ